MMGLYDLFNGGQATQKMMGGMPQTGLLGQIGRMFSPQEQQAYQAIRNVGQQEMGRMAQMPGAGQMAGGFNQGGQMPNLNLTGPIQGMGPTAIDNSMARQQNQFRTMAGMPNPMTQGSPMSTSGLLANGNPMGGGGMDPMSMALLGMGMIGGDEEQQPMSLPPGGGTPRMNPMAGPQMMRTGQMLRRRGR